MIQNHVPHTTKYEKVINLVVACAGKHLQEFFQGAEKNATHKSRTAVTELVKAMGIWLFEVLQKRLSESRIHSLMSDECTDLISSVSVILCVKIPNVSFLSSTCQVNTYAIVKQKRCG